MAKVAIVVCDNCGTRIEDEPHVLTVTRKGSRTVKFADLCDSCEVSLTGNFPVRGKRGAKPREAVNGISNS